MKITKIGVLAAVLLSCVPPETEETCLCDCPDGPPAPPALDMFCADDTNAGEACCRPEGGVCQGLECAVCGPQVSVPASLVCFAPTCCETSAATLAHLCTDMLPGSEPIVCGEALVLAGCEALLEPVRCAWDGASYTVLCCNLGAL